MNNPAGPAATARLFSAIRKPRREADPLVPDSAERRALLASQGADCCIGLLYL